MEPQGSATEPPSSGRWPEFVVWVVLGLVFCLSFLVFPTAGLVLILIAAVLAVRRPTLRRSWFGALVGIGVILLYVAYVQRHGPGTVCWQRGTEAGCDEYLNPWPWLVAGAAFVAAGVIGQVRSVRGPSSVRVERRTP